MTPRISSSGSAALKTDRPEPTKSETPCKRFSVALGDTPPAALPTAQPIAPAPAAPLPSGPLSGATRMVTRLLEGERSVEHGLERALRGGAMSQEELLALQVNVIRYSQELEVASRIVEKVTGAVKQTLQTQV
jgi:hypothetical protein